MTEQPLPPDLETEQDDEVVGQAFKASLIVFALIGAGVAAFFLLRSEEEAPAFTETGSGPAPQAVVTDVDPPEVLFRDVTQAAGITFVHENGARGDKLLPETMGGGSVFFDYDEDGDVDLLLVNSTTWDEADGEGASSVLYANDGAGKFTDVTAAAGLTFRSYGMGAAVGDYDCDGDTDLFITAVGKNRMFRNDGGRFTEVDVGVSGEEADWSTCAAFFDSDGDGDLDLFVGNYVHWSRDVDLEVDYRLTGIGRAYGPPSNFGGSFSRLFQNDGGTFSEVSEAAGMRVVNPATGAPVGKALGVVVRDFDGDGDADLIVANDTVQNHVFVNRGDGTFDERGARLGLAFDSDGRATGAMGIDAASYRADGGFGVAIGNFANEMSSLYLARSGGEFFVDVAIAEGVGAPSRRVLSFGLFFFDYDLDGRLDLLAANGHLEDEISVVQPSQSYTQPAQLFWNAGSEARRRFVEVSAESGDLAKPIVGRGANYADIDGDGDLDVLLTQSGGPPILLRNDQALGHHWLRLRVRGDGCNTDALGARVVVTRGEEEQVLVSSPTRSYLTQTEPFLTFGLGTSAEPVDVRVIWPDGRARDFPSLEVDRVHELRPEE